MQGGSTPGILSLPYHEIHKWADQFVNNTTILQDDAALVLPVLDFDVLEIFLHLEHRSELTATPGIDFDFTFPIAAALHYIKSFVNTGQQTPKEEETINTSVTRQATLYHILYVGGDWAGSLQLRWAQHVATLENTYILTNSRLLYRKLM